MSGQLCVGRSGGQAGGGDDGNLIFRRQHRQGFVQVIGRSNADDITATATVVEEAIHRMRKVALVSVNRRAGGIYGSGNAAYSRLGCSGVDLDLEGTVAIGCTGGGLGTGGRPACAPGHSNAQPRIGSTADEGLGGSAAAFRGGIPSRGGITADEITKPLHIVVPGGDPAQFQRLCLHLVFKPAER